MPGTLNAQNTPSQQGPPRFPSLDVPTSLPLLPPPDPRTPLSSMSIMLSFQRCAADAITQHMTFGGWLFSLSVIPRRSTVCSFSLRSSQYSVVLDEPQVNNPPTESSWALPGFCYYEYSCYKHSGADFCMDVSCHVSEINAQECNCWVTW